MGPAELLDYGRDGLIALVLEDAAPSSHVAIVGRAMGLPLVGNIEGIVDNARAGDSIVIDGEPGEVQLRRAPEVVRAFEIRRALREQRAAEMAVVRDLPARCSRSE